MSDIAVTWPKGRRLESYLEELRAAKRRREVINYRLPARPREDPERCYMVYDGAVRGYNNVTDVGWIGPGVVRDPISGLYWRAGWYITRDPTWYACKLVAMKGFQGFRIFDRTRA